MTLTPRKKGSNNTSNELNASSTPPPFPNVCLRQSIQPARLNMVETLVRHSDDYRDDEPQNDTSFSCTQQREQSGDNIVATAITPRRAGWNRTRTLSGGLPERKVENDNDDDDDDDFIPTTPVDESLRWNSNKNFNSMTITPPRTTIASVYAASAPRQRRRKPARSRSPSPRHGSNHKRSSSYSDAWLIPHQHPVKMLWDVCTVILSIANAYATHMAIRDRETFSSPFMRFCEIWFVLDILLNFCTQRTTHDGTVVLRTYRAVWARYLTSWFVVDVLSLFPAELMWVQPIVEAQKRRNVWQKGFFRTRAVVRVSRWLRLQHVRYLARASQHTKRAAGIGFTRFVRLLIRYAPKYILFIRKTRGVLAVRALRQVRWMRQMVRDLGGGGGGDKPDHATWCNMTEEDNNLYNSDSAVADWEVLDDDDDDVPF